ncbi:MAG: polymerase ECF-type sigma factor [Chitinophagaceae bacterium]|nr:polymerase ECF-type sigma factor [Chitinophagaceae bacterium]
MAGKLQPISSPDEQLAEDYRLNGNQQKLAELYLRYSDMVYAVGIKYLKNQDKARDAAMNIYEELVEKLRHHQVDNFKSWLYVLTKNHCLMQLRKEKATNVVELTNDFMQSGETDHLDDALNKETELNQLENCIDKLAVNQQRIIRLFYLQEHSYHQIAAATGLEWNAVRSLVQNGRRNLKICMENNER